MEPLLILPVLVSFFLTLILIPKWIKKCEQSGLLWEDMNKPGHPRNVASSGGVIVVLAFVLSILFYIAIRTFVIQDVDGTTTKIFSLLTTILILAIVGLTDDLLGWKNEGLSIRFRLFLVLFASIPLVVINAGMHQISIPFIGSIEIGALYVLLFIPVGIVGATFGYNNLAGFNGLESSQGIIIIGFLSLIAYFTNSSWLALVGLCMVVSLFAFYIFNKNPARVFPGDILTYSIGALIAVMAILGNFERIAIFIFIPYILEVMLKIRGRIKFHKFPQCFAKPNSDGSLEMPYEKIYSLTHLSLFILKKFKKKVYEQEVVYLINAFQILLCIIALFLFKQYIFI